MARSPSGGRAAGADPDERIAVVFVHGQGEQTPMADVIDLADTVWRSDPRAWGNHHPPEIDGRDVLAPVYSVPVYDQAESDQRRITTRIVKMPDGLWRQVDFYQFYWADLMRGNRFVHLWIWFTRLMVREPSEVPHAVWEVRQLAMTAALILGAWGVVFALATALRLALAVSAPSLGLLILILAGSILAVVSGWRTRKKPPNKRKADAAAERTPLWVSGVGLLLCVLLAWPHLANLHWLIPAAIAAELAWLAALGGLSQPTAPQNDRQKWGTLLAWAGVLFGLLLLYAASLGAGALPPLGWNWRNVLALMLAGGAVATLPLLFAPYRRAAAMAGGGLLTVLSLLISVYILFRPDDFDAGWAGLGQDRQSIVALHTAAAAGMVVLAAVGGYFAYQLNESFLTPVMADSARMFSNSPPAIPNQDAIRKRGMELLEFLHDPTAQRRYDRVVVLAHSLGTAVAYRLLAHYWGKVYGRLPVAKAAAQAAEVEAKAVALDAAPGDVTRRAWRQAVRDYGKALRDAAPPAPGGVAVGADRPWLITDFVTIGSPLTYARLLLEESDRDFLRQIRIYKRHPTSPPQPADVLDEKAKPKGPIFGHGTWPHHAALFAATTWTNLFFPPSGLSRGDLIGGPIARNPPEGLGLGVLDVNLEADNEVEGFTHGNYWLWPVNMRLEVSPSGTPPGAPPAAPLHVAALRDALGLFETGDAVDQRLQRPADYELMKLALDDRGPRLPPRPKAAPAGSHPS